MKTVGNGGRLLALQAACRGVGFLRRNVRSDGREEHGVQKTQEERADEAADAAVAQGVGGFVAGVQAGKKCQAESAGGSEGEEKFHAATE
jgi:hypothetical protein